VFKLSRAAATPLLQIIGTTTQPPLLLKPETTGSIMTIIVTTIISDNMNPKRKRVIDIVTEIVMIMITNRLSRIIKMTMSRLRQCLAMKKE
jgi:hypothetical protein